MNKVYLAGGFHGELREHAKDLLQAAGLYVFDPSQTGLQHPEEYVAADLKAIRSSQVVFAFMEDRNPSGYPLCAEIGYAHGLGIPVVFLDQMSQDDSRRHSFDFIRPMCRVTTSDLGVAWQATVDILEQAKRS